MSILKAVKVSRAPFFGLGIVGLYWGTFSAMVPELKAQVGASDAQLGWALMTAAIGGMAAMFLAPKVAKALGKYQLPVLAVLLALLSQLPVFAHSLPFMFVMMVVLGAGVSGFDITSNMRLSELEERHGLHLMNVNHAMFSLCFGLSALAVGWMRQSGMGIAEVFPLMGGVLLLVSLLTWEKNWKPMHKDEGDAAAPASLPWFFILTVSVMLFVSFVGENATESWSALFIERELGGAVGHGSFGPTTLGLVMFTVRLLGQVFTEKLGEKRVVLWSGVFGVIGSLVMALASTQTVALLGIGISAVGMAVIVPTANSLLGKLVHREQRAIAMSRAWMFGFSGFFIGPALIGFVSQHWGLRVAFVIVAGLVATIIPAVLMIKSKRAAT
ncbi:MULTISPECIES: MFS transporter [Pacificibacter]|uniref:MFS transporter n=1 Tax=Pacificibacter TaxID=1042323 RepID=UPI001C089AA0|nr:MULTISPECIES: MFS transporter [Pacificibacter]MBU2934613.1 MFS transporter [Pacificibacter marinus]MDO6616943.1 MFS transporter [Pacificibacter sp. 1_MG-2023]